MLGSGDRRALYVVAALTSVGWTEDMQGEGQAIARHLGMDWNTVRWTVDDFDRRLGIAPRGGRLRYISPTPLGIHLAVEAWSTYPDLLKSLPAELPSERARDAYYKRLQAIASNTEAQGFAREQLDLFFRVDDFFDARAVRRWSALSSATLGASTTSGPKAPSRRASLISRGFGSALAVVNVRQCSGRLAAWGGTRLCGYERGTR